MTMAKRLDLAKLRNYGKVSTCIGPASKPTNSIPSPIFFITKNYQIGSSKVSLPLLTTVKLDSSLSTEYE